MLTPTEKIWHNGRFIKWDDAKIHVLSHVVSYGSSVFEGIRCYETVAGPAIFRLREHVRRLVDSAKIYRIDAGFTVDQLCDAMVELVSVNKLNPATSVPSCCAATATWASTEPSTRRKYIWRAGNGASTWARKRWPRRGRVHFQLDRIAPNTLPALAKAGANYMNSQLIRMEAQVNGYSEGIALDRNGCDQRRSGENVFVVRDGKILTPPLGSSVLPGITRDTVMTLAQQLDIPVMETVIPREMLYIADEVFFSGTAAEITPIRSVDRIMVGKGKRGPITEQIQKEFFAIVRRNFAGSDRLADPGWSAEARGSEPVIEP